MKLMQQPTKMTPIAIVFESWDDVYHFWDIINTYKAGGPADKKTYQMAVRISNYLTNEAKI